MKTTTIALLLCPLLLLTAACGQTAETTAGTGETPAPSEPTDGEGTPATTTDRSMLESGTWTLTDGAESESPLPLVDVWPITLTFSENTLGGTASCNGYGSAYRIVDDELTIDGVGSEDQGCEPAVMEAESRYLAGADGGRPIPDRDRRR